MSTFISLVVVGVCVVATTWLVLRDGGKPATHASRGHRAVPTDPVPRATSTGDESDQRPDEVPATTATDPAPAPLRRQPEQVVAPEADPRHDAPAAVTTAAPVTPARRGGRARAPERVRARRRDHVHLGDPDPDAMVLVSPADLPEPQPAATSPTQRVRAGLSLVVMLLAFGIAAAIVLGVTIILISDLLENAVK